MLNRKLLRELWGQRGLLAAVVVVIALGVTLFVGSAAGYLDLSTSYLRLEDDLHLADLHVDATVDDADVARIQAVPGVAAVDRRTVGSLPIAVGDARLEGRVITLPDDRAPRLDQLHLLSGTLPSPGEVVLETHFANHFDLGAGDAITADLGPAGTRAYRVSGVAVSVEYLWVARDDQDPMPTPSEFGVLWMRRSDARDAARSTLAALGPQGMISAPAALQAAIASVRTAAGDRDSQVLVELQAGADLDAVTAAIEQELGERVRRITPRSRLIGRRLLQMDVDGLRGMALFFPVFFLGVSAFVFAAVMARIVDGQRAIVGTLVALGVPRRRILGHYLAFGLAVGGAGALLGTGGGILAGWGLTSAYAGVFQIPEITVDLRPGLWLTGAASGLAVAGLAALGPARQAAAMRPADAMRPPAPPSGRALLGLRHLGALPLSVRLAVRGIARRPARSLATSLGVAAAVVLVLTSSSLVESTALAVRVQAEEAWRYDLRADLVAPIPATDLQSRALAVAGALDAEVALTLPVRIAGLVTKDTLAQGLAPGARLLRSVDFAGAEQLPAPGGIALPRHLAKELGVGPGDRVQVRLLPDGAETSLRVDGLADAAIGGVVVLRLAELAALSGAEDRANTVVLTVEPAHLVAARDELYSLPGVVRVQDIAGLRALVDQLTAVVWVLVSAMLAASVILASAVLYDTASLSILERQREFATLRALGRSMGAIALTITLEHGALSMLGMLLGLPVAVLTIHYVLGLYASELFAMPFVFSGRTVGVAMLGVGLVLLVAQWPALRQVARANLAEAVRTREG